MKAAVLFKTGEPLQIIDDIQMPPLSAGQVQVNILYSGLCHSQLMEVQGGRGEDKYLPHLLGHEGVGIVEGIGDGVTKIKPGDKVVIGWIQGEGLNAPGGKYPHKGYLINSGSATTLCEKSIVAENRLVKLPPTFPDKLAVLLGCALPTGLGLVFNELKPEKERTIAIFGLGGIGMSALLAAKLSEPTKLIAVDVNEDKLSLAKELGATHTIDASKVDAVKEIYTLTNGIGVDYSLEAGGTVQTIEQAFESVKDGGGQCVFASHPSNELKISLEPHAFHRGKSIRGSWGGGSNPDKDIPKFVELYQQGQLNLEALLTHNYELEDINQALQDLHNKKIVRALIKIAQ
ncbi:zinc-binding dehydrogenase [Pseudoalteromonas luteoviolacea]|uniref:Acetoin dehydrogenase n=1 Tax=Pseudoalteromonas luteoviolacea H33 TaxID=1365251 RepID=A0A167C384_9GAMM|nr:zinc-binding dehydrogenase [Pseudoalteromonas luteoviolacea]KZN47184.1 acetoin dehydrogenase [Pseudoalteromonas luteoviolacea H33]KZN77200.1 acetoin dehydrogenase [Pseudoalteromonas luteoviolacea H33-S]MBQ4879353.1 zinc-binding dehydrogenase [Pseudoalteromonas luteoviolacea]MBQ4908413.1 zinc-binding dehydrogenase [Pseudoalteromonas luteoviolacea]